MEHGPIIDGWQSDRDCVEECLREGSGDESYGKQEIESIMSHSVLRDLKFPKRREEPPEALWARKKSGDATSIFGILLTKLSGQRNLLICHQLEVVKIDQQRKEHSRRRQAEREPTHSDEIRKVDGISDEAVRAMCQEFIFLDSERHDAI
jgi:hypothetical protein